MKYRIRAINSGGEVCELDVEGLSTLDARRQVEARGLYVAKVLQQGGGLGLGGLLGKRGSVELPLVLFSQELLALLEAGLSIVESLEALAEKESNPGVRAVFQALLESLHNGKRLSAALAEHPSLFPPLYLGVMRAAEGTSDLPRSLQRYIDYQSRIDAVRQKVISASIYPTILVAVGLSVTVFLMAYVVPRFAEVYQGAGRELPWMSALLLGWGQFAAQHSSILLTLLCCIFAVVFVYWHKARASGGWAFLMGRLPGLRERVRIYELARLYLTMGMLLEGGIALVPAMQTALEVVSPFIRKALESARANVQNGTPLSAAFHENGLTTPISLRMLSVGERSGDMGAMLMKSASFYDGEISRWIDRFMRSFEPILMAVIGIVIGVIVVLLYMPIFDLAGSF